MVFHVYLNKGRCNLRDITRRDDAGVGAKEMAPGETGIQQI